MRLNRDTSWRIPGAQVPAYNRDTLTNGIVHIGAGNFHRAHQAVYTDDVLRDDSRWGLIGASLHSSSTRDRLCKQDFLYTVQERDPNRSDSRVIGAITDVLYLGEQRASLIEALSRPEIKVVTLTVTEKGYCHTSEGELDDQHPDIRHDLENPSLCRSMPGVLASGIAARRRAGAGPLSIISCDNLSDNGRVLQKVVHGFTRQLDRSLADWCSDHLSFPNTMVDRIVPQTADQDIALFSTATGVRDDAMLTTEPFKQWVIEDSFIAERPPWELAGAQIVTDVAQFESVKLRILNAAHSTLAYLGLLLGYEHVHEAMADDSLALFVESLLQDEVIPLLGESPNMDLDRYKCDVLDRFRNSAIPYGTAQVATDGSKKLPQRIVPSLGLAIAQNRRSAGLELVFAAWLLCMKDADLVGQFDDPAKEADTEADLLAMAGVDAHMARMIITRYRSMARNNLRTEIAAVTAGR